MFHAEPPFLVIASEEVKQRIREHDAGGCPAAHVIEAEARFACATALLEVSMQADQLSQRLHDLYGEYANSERAEHGISGSNISSVRSYAIALMRAMDKWSAHSEATASAVLINDREGERKKVVPS